jgi:salicylate hydroxylase
MGVGTEVRSRSVVLEHIKVLRWQDGQVLQNAKMTTHPQREHLVIHRADLHNILVKAVLRLPNVDLRVNSTVVDFDFERAAITLLDGSVITGDLVLAADGIKSTARRKLLSVSGEHDAIEPTGDSAYRVILTREQMVDDPELKELIDDPSVSRWLGPGRHIVGYPIRNHSLYNIVLIHPDHSDQDEVWTTEVTKEEMCRDYEGWDNRIQKLIDRVDQSNILQWRLYLHKPLPTWLKGTTALLGDACHPML